MALSANHRRAANGKSHDYVYGKWNHDVQHEISLDCMQICVNKSKLTGKTVCTMWNLPIRCRLKQGFHQVDQQGLIHGIKHCNQFQSLEHLWGFHMVTVTTILFQWTNGTRSAKCHDYLRHRPWWTLLQVIVCFQVITLNNVTSRPLAFCSVQIKYKIYIITLITFGIQISIMIITHLPAENVLNDLSFFEMSLAFHLLFWNDIPV